MKILLLCGEMSGENLLHSYLDAFLADASSDLHFWCQTSHERWVSAGYDHHPQCHFVADRSVCSVMGILQPLWNVRPLLQRFFFLKQLILQESFDLVIGFDNPDFLLPLEKVAKDSGSYVVHVVSPSAVWAWRPSRVYTIARNVNELHYLFSFEKKYYQNVPNLVMHDIGHPLLRSVQLIKRSGPCRTLLLAPGSRLHEIKKHAQFFWTIAKELLDRGLIDHVIMSQAPHIDRAHYPHDPQIEFSSSWEQAIQSADFAFVCSGTASLEVAARGCPQFIFYHIEYWKLFLMKKIATTPFVGLPNVLAQEEIAREWLGLCDQKMKDAVIDAWISLDHSAYAQKTYDMMNPIIQHNQEICLKTICKNLLLQVSMKQAVDA